MQIVRMKVAPDTVAYADGDDPTFGQQGRKTG